MKPKALDCGRHCRFGVEGGEADTVRKLRCSQQFRAFGFRRPLR
jgi:hypothetical protein